MSKFHVDAYMLAVARVVAVNSTCMRASVGTVLVRDKRIISTGFNGAPSGLEDCMDGGCVMYQDADRARCINTIHAEANAIARAREVGDTLYTTHNPCLNCYKLALAHNPNIRILYLIEYKDEARDAFIRHHGSRSPIPYSVEEVQDLMDIV